MKFLDIYNQDKNIIKFILKDIKKVIKIQILSWEMK